MTSANNTSHKYYIDFETFSDILMGSKGNWLSYDKISFLCASFTHRLSWRSVDFKIEQIIIVSQFWLGGHLQSAMQNLRAGRKNGPKPVGEKWAQNCFSD